MLAPKRPRNRSLRPTRKPRAANTKASAEAIVEAAAKAGKIKRRCDRAREVGRGLHPRRGRHKGDADGIEVKAVAQGRGAGADRCSCYHCRDRQGNEDRTHRPRPGGRGVQGGIRCEKLTPDPPLPCHDSTCSTFAKLRGNDATVGLIEANIKSRPEVELFPFRTIRGTSYKTGIRTGLPTVGFRNANEGQTPTKSTFEQKIIEAFIFGGQIEIDKAVADADERGAEYLKALEASGVTLAAMRAIGSQIWYGTTQDAKGFPGLKAATVFGGTTQNGDPLTINATGSTASTASSVYAVKFGEQDVTLIGGNDSAFTLGEWMIQQIVTSGTAR